MSTTNGTPTASRVEVDGRPVRVLEQGVGQPVVLLHGLGLGADLWAPHLERLAAAGYRGLAPDLPGFGESPGPRTGMSVDAVAEWLDELSLRLGLRTAAWVGHSLAAQQLARLAVKRPERVAALVLAAPVGRSGLHPLRQAGGLAKTAFQEPPGLVMDVTRHYVRAPVTTVTNWLRALRHDLELDAPRIRAPTLLVVGDRDAIVPEPFLHRLLRLIPDSRLERLEGAAHAVALEAVDAFCDAVSRFLLRRYGFGSVTSP